MARIASEIIYKIIGDETDLVKSLQKAEKDTAAFGKKLEGIGKKLSLGLTAPIVAAGTAAVKLASDTGEAFNAANVVFRESTGIIEAWGKNAVEQAGLTSAEFYQASAVIGAGLINAGQSADEAARQTIELTKRAADMASIFNTDVNDALLALQSGLRGESEPLRRFAVNLNEAAVNAKAVELGLSASEKEVSDYAKSQARLSIILEQTNRFQGDFVNTSDQLANGTRILKASIKEQASELGQQLLPAILQIVSKGRELVSAFSNLDENGKKLVLTIGGIAAAFGPVVTLAGKLIAGGPIALGISAIAIAAGLLAKNIYDTQVQLEELKKITSGDSTKDLQAQSKIIDERIAAINREIAGVRKYSDVAAKRLEEEVAYLKATKLVVEQKIEAQEREAKARKDSVDAVKSETVAVKESKDVTDKYAQSRKLVLETLGKEKTEYQLIQEKIDALSATPWATGQLEKDRLATIAILRAQQQEIIQQEIDEESKARADAYGDYIVNLAKIEDARREAGAQELARIEAERKAREIAIEQAAQFIYSQLTTVGDQLLQNEIDRINASTLSEKEKAAEIAKVKQKQAIFDKAQALANIAMRTSEAIVSALTVPPPAGQILAGVIAGLAAVQAASVIAQPLPPIPSFAQGTRNFMVPPGFPNDSFPIMVQSGERVTVETPQQQVGEQGDSFMQFVPFFFRSDRWGHDWHIPVKFSTENGTFP